MRTTIRLDDDLLRAAKLEAVARGRTLTALIDDALRRELARGSRARQPHPELPLSRVQGNGLQPGVDLDDSASLLDLMEGT